MDPYKVLGVERNATDGDIRRVFRKLAKELHPDLNPDDTTSGERFKKVSAAYELLGDPAKRRAYDRGEIDGFGEPRRGFGVHGMGGAYGTGGGAGFGGARYGAGGRGGGRGGANFGFGDVFEDVFSSPPWGSAQARSRPPARGADVRYTLEVDFLESVNGAKKRVTLPEGGVLDLSVPEGVNDGQVLRLKGKGGIHHGAGPAGDALVEIKVRAHSLFSRSGLDIRSEIPITLYEAVLGGKIEVSTISGRVQLSLPAGTSSGRVFRLKGKGVSKKPGGETGDHLASVRITMPSQVNDDLKSFFEKWRKTNGYDPGQR